MKRKKKVRKLLLSPKSAELLSAFDSAAMNWGYQSDSGVGNEVARSKKAYDEASDALTKHIRRLELARQRLHATRKLRSPAEISAAAFSNL